MACLEFMQKDDNEEISFLRQNRVGVVVTVFILAGLAFFAVKFMQGAGKHATAPSGGCYDQAPASASTANSSTAADT